MPFAGHPNVGTGYVLARRMDNPPEHLVFEEIAGLVRVHLLRDADGAITGARISAPRALSIDIGIPDEVVAACAGLQPDDIATNAHTPLVASVGIPFVIAEVASVAALSRATPDLAAFRAAAARYPIGPERFALLLYARRDGDATRLRARMFAPLGGMLEDPATGSANAALAALLTSLAPGENVDLTYDIEQGVEMGRPSQIIATAQQDGGRPGAGDGGGKLRAGDAGHGGGMRQRIDRRCHTAASNREASGASASPANGFRIRTPCRTPPSSRSSVRITEQPASAAVATSSASQ